MNESKVNVEMLDVTKLVEREGFKCPECKHKHSGKTLGYICIGCPCDCVPDFGAIKPDAGKVDL